MIFIIFLFFYFFKALSEKPTPKVLRRLAKRIPDDWQDLGAELGVDEPTIQNILANGTQFPKPNQKAYQMLLRWSRMMHTPTYGKLKEALEKVRRHDLVVWLFDRSSEEMSD